MEYGQVGDLTIKTPDGFQLLDTFGIYINIIADMEYREELLKILIPMQHEVEREAFAEENTNIEDTEETKMTM